MLGMPDRPPIGPNMQLSRNGEPAHTVPSQGVFDDYFMKELSSMLRIRINGIMRTVQRILPGREHDTLCARVREL